MVHQCSEIIFSFHYLMFNVLCHHGVSQLKTIHCPSNKEAKLIMAEVVAKLEHNKRTEVFSNYILR